MCVVVDQRDLLGDLIVELARERVVRALGRIHDLLQRGFFLIIEIHVEVRGVIDVPVELVVDDLVLPEGERGQCGEGDDQQRDATLHGTSWRAAGGGQRAGHRAPPAARRPLPAYSVNTYRVADVSCGTKMPTS